MLKTKHENLSYILIRKKLLAQNHQVFKKAHPEASVCHVLKSNAFGHGIKQVAPIFDSFRSPLLIVDSLHEAEQLSSERVQTPILILGFINDQVIKKIRLPYDITISSLEYARLLNRYQKKCKAHIFVDTGMSREGIPLSQLRLLFRKLKTLKNIHVEGLASHLSDADNPNNLVYTFKQIQAYKESLEIAHQEGFFPKWRHISASAGAFKINNPMFNLIRIGISSYGISPIQQTDHYNNKIHLLPILQYNTTLVLIKTVNRGTMIGYNNTFTARKNMTLGLLPVGYFNGVDRRLSNKGFVKINNSYCPIVGRISMNLTIIDISEVNNARIGDEVIIYSSIRNDLNSISNTALAANTIPHDILVGIPEFVERIVV